MAALSIRELNANISKVIARVEAGETIHVTRNGRVVAELRPKRPVRDEAWRRAYKESVEVLRRGFPGKVGRITEEDKYGDANL
ncbi:MAG TPA: type II toxin-antitoxin system prevent-host-death family antitoxin [Sphingomicrobium sp.]|nr:type II toxin-antitoxin system prevent-host-death family antitoxin [Sphingomicrobium sp.]